jgi:AraC-like DNA-binding protein
VTEVAINPPASAFGCVNAILNGRSARHYESRFAGPLSVKAVISGRATWETDDGRYELVPGSVLLLNDGEEYLITVDALQPVETFCFFFERGFVEDAYRAATNGSARLLDGQAGLPALHFDERLHFDSPLVDEVLRAHRDRSALAESFYSLALQLVRAQASFGERIAKLPSLRAATREELARRLGVATSYLHANSARGVTVAEAARAACLSPFHFHRLFTRFHGITPHRYLARLRLERARALLRADDGSVLDVAVACGFESLGSFSALYKKTFGVTPSGVRRR